MMYISYFELNENMSMEERMKITEKLTSSGIFPPKDVNIVRWDITPDMWGVLILEGEDQFQVARALDVWRASGAGFFKETKTSMAMPVHEVMTKEAEFLKSLETV